MFQLRCTVRDCRELLERREKGLFCSKGHHFDRAKEGYWSLLQPQDRKSRNPGDADAAVLARHRWLERGHAGGLVEALNPWVEATDPSDAGVAPRTLDLGCGEGSFAPLLFADQGEHFCGIDLSKRAIKLAARGWPIATWVLANADRGLPVADASVTRVLSLFGRRPAGEIGRVLSPGGHCIVAVPGESDLIELREKVQQVGRRRSRCEAVIDEMSAGGMECCQQQSWQHRVRLDPEAIADALAMTYRAVRHSEQSRRESLPAMEVTLAADLMLFRRPA